MLCLEVEDLALPRERRVDDRAESAAGCRPSCRRSSRSGSARCRRALPEPSSRRTCSPSSSNEVEPDAGRDDDVVDERAGELHEVVARVADRDLDARARVAPRGRRATARSRRSAPLAGPPRRRCVPRRRAGAVAVVGLVVLEERVEPEPERADEPGVVRSCGRSGRGSVVQSSQPTVCASTNDEVPVLLGVAGDPERQRRAAGRHRDRARQPLVRRAGSTCEIANCVPVRGAPVGSKRSGSNASQKRMPSCL